MNDSAVDGVGQPAPSGKKPRVFANHIAVKLSWGGHCSLQNFDDVHNLVVDPVARKISLPAGGGTDAPVKAVCAFSFMEQPRNSTPQLGRGVEEGEGPGFQETTITTVTVASSHAASSSTCGPQFRITFYILFGGSGRRKSTVVAALKSSLLLQLKQAAPALDQLDIEILEPTLKGTPDTLAWLPSELDAALQEVQREEVVARHWATRPVCRCSVSRHGSEVRQMQARLLLDLSPPPLLQRQSAANVAVAAASGQPSEEETMVELTVPADTSAAAATDDGLETQERLMLEAVKKVQLDLNLLAPLQGHESTKSRHVMKYVIGLTVQNIQQKVVIQQMKDKIERLEKESRKSRSATEVLHEIHTLVDAYQKTASDNIHSIAETLVNLGKSTEEKGDVKQYIFSCIAASKDHAATSKFDTCSYLAVRSHHLLRTCRPMTSMELAATMLNVVTTEESCADESADVHIAATRASADEVVRLMHSTNAKMSPLPDGPHMVGSSICIQPDAEKLQKALSEVARTMEGYRESGVTGGCCMLKFEFTTELILPHKILLVKDGSTAPVKMDPSDFVSMLVRTIESALHAKWKVHVFLMGCNTHSLVMLLRKNAALQGGLSDVMVVYTTEKLPGALVPLMDFAYSYCEMADMVQEHERRAVYMLDEWDRIYEVCAGECLSDGSKQPYSKRVHWTWLIDVKSD